MVVLMVATASARRRSLTLIWFLVAAVVSISARQANAPAPRIVRVTAERFAFTPSEIKAAPGTVIEFQLKSEDTAHGFRIIGQNVDLTIPKRGRGIATVQFAPPAPGDYVFECSRMCGAGHSFMRGVIRITDGGKEKSR
jgi:cytochrome c oxidase subunit 2